MVTVVVELDTMSTVVADVGMTVWLVHVVTRVGDLGKGHRRLGNTIAGACRRVGRNATAGRGVCGDS